MIRRFDDIESYRSGNVYKTHFFPPAELPDNVKVVFLFGDVLNTVISTHRMINQWGARHYHHLGAPRYRTNDDVFDGDSLNLLGHFDEWYRPQGFPFVSVRYETLYSASSRAVLSRFLGFDLRLLPHRERETNGRAHPKRDRILEQYGELDRRVRAAEDARFWPARTAEERRDRFGATVPSIRARPGTGHRPLPTSRTDEASGSSSAY